jgi:hypothetical protein
MPVRGGGTAIGLLLRGKEKGINDAERVETVVRGEEGEGKR